MSNKQAKAVLHQSLEMSSAEIVRARRACTVPQQLLRSYTLPSLANTQTVPKRYEETKPVKVQNFTHQRIIDLGEFINKQSREEYDKIKQLAVEKAVADTWEAAHDIKTQAVKEALEKQQAQHDKQIRKLVKQHERAIKEEALQVETMMQNKMREALEAERIVAEKKLEDSIIQVKAAALIQLEEAVAAARQEEQQEAHREKMKILEDASRALEITRQKLNKDKETALVQLDKKLQAEKVAAVETLREAETTHREVMLADLRQKHLVELEEVRSEIEVIENKVSDRDIEILKIQRKREQLYDELIKVQADYQDFIDKHPLFDPGQTSYLLPDFRANPQVENPYSEVSSKAKMKSERKNSLKWSKN